MTDYEQNVEKLRVKRQELQEMTKDASTKKFTDEQLDDIKSRNAELEGLHHEVKKVQDLVAIGEENARQLKEYNTPAAGGGNVGFGTPGRPESAEQRAARKSLGEIFVDSPGYKGWRSRGANQYAATELDGLGFKATFTETAATFTAYDRQPLLVTVGVQPPTVADLLAKGQTTMNTIRYPQEDTFTNAATTVAEGATKPEATFDTSEVDAPVRKIAVTAKVTDELYMDFPALRDYINQRLPFMVQLIEDQQLLNGNGTPPQLTGILQTAGIQTQAKGGDDAFTAVFKALTKVRSVGFFEPDGSVFHPTDWQNLRTTKDLNGNFIYGSPAIAGPSTIWGLPVVVTTAITVSNALVGSFKMGAQIFYRNGLTIESTNSNEDDFKKNLIAIRCEQREALAVYRPKAFCTITGL